MTGEPADRRLRLEPAWAGPVITLLAAGAYLLGYLETAFFASALGLTARDLGLDAKDYTMLALVHLVGVGLAVFGMWVTELCDADLNARAKAWVEAATAKGRRRFLLLAGKFAGALVISIAAFAVVGVNVGEGLVVAGVLIVAWLGLPAVGRRREPLPLAIAGVVVLLIVGGLAGYAADVYASHLRRDARAGHDIGLPPLPLRSVLQPEVGIATHGWQTTCAIRVSPHVLLGRRATTVVEVERFTVGRCDLADVPFG